MYEKKGAKDGESLLSEDLTAKKERHVENETKSTRKTSNYESLANLISFIYPVP